MRFHLKSRRAGARRSVLVRLVAAVFAIAVLAPAHGQAAPVRTLSFTATNPVVINGDPFGTLPHPGASLVTGNFTFDPMAGPFAVGPDGTGLDEVLQAERPFISFNASILAPGGVITLVSEPSAESSGIQIFVRDAVGDDASHGFAIVSSDPTEGEVAPDIFLDFFAISVGSESSANPFDGTDVPSAAVLNSLNLVDLVDNLFAGFVFSVVDETNFPTTVTHAGAFTNVVFTEVSAVPLPAALPLLASALAGFGLFGWRRRRAAAA